MKTFKISADGSLKISRWSFGSPDNDPPHRNYTLAECKLPNGDTVKLKTNHPRSAFWLTGSGDGFAGNGCSRVINSVCSRNPKIVEAWRAAIAAGKVEISHDPL